MDINRLLAFIFKFKIIKKKHTHTKQEMRVERLKSLRKKHFFLFLSLSFKQRQHLFFEKAFEPIKYRRYEIMFLSITAALVQPEIVYRHISMLFFFLLFLKSSYPF